MRKSEQTNEICTALISVQKELETVPKKGKNSDFGNKYVELEDALAGAIPALNKYNIFLAQTVDQNCLLTTLLHTSGQWIESAIPLINKKGDDQGQGGSITYAKRYGLLSILGIPTEDDDGNMASISPPREESYKKHIEKRTEPQSAQNSDSPKLPNRAPGADSKWSEYTIKNDKFNKGKTLKQAGLPWVMKQLEYWEGKELKSKALKDDVLAFNGFVQEMTEANVPKIFRGNSAPATKEYSEPKWKDESYGDPPPFASDEEPPF